MKKVVVFTIAGLMTVLTACGNKDWIDTNFSYNKAIIRLQNGDIIEGEVQNWRDYDDGDQIQVQINGNVYLVHSSNIDLIREPDK